MPIMCRIAHAGPGAEMPQMSHDMHVHSKLMCFIRPAFSLDSDLCSMVCFM
eukprot:jgi/Botrbrau1/6490/Bobra.0034s0063.1